MQQQLWVVSEIYYPEETSTGYLLTKIAEGLARDQRVRVLCGQPAYSGRGVKAPIHESRNGVEIERCSGTTFPKDNLPLRLVNALTISLSILLKSIVKIKRGDIVLVVTNPPPLPFIIALVCMLKGARFLLLIHDVYPEVLAATGLTSPTSLLSRTVASVNRWLYRRAERVIVLGRDMEALAINKVGNRRDRIVIIPNWADHTEIIPGDRAANSLLNELNLQDKFVMQYAGNMGRTHGLEYVMAAAKSLQNDPRFQFLFIGSGAKKKFVEDQAKDLSNVTVLGNRPRSDQQNFLNACDISIISVVPGMAGVSVPSRMYNVMASGTPIVAIADPHSELALVVLEEKIGWLVAPNDPVALERALREAASDPSRLEELGNRARSAVELKYTLEAINALYSKMITSLNR